MNSGKFVNQSPEENRERVSIVGMAAIQEGKITNRNNYPIKRIVSLSSMVMVGGLQFPMQKVSPDYLYPSSFSITGFWRQ